MSYYNRYKDFKVNGKPTTVPLILLPKKVVIEKWYIK